MHDVRPTITSHACWQVLDFKAGNVWKVMVASYETLRKHTDALAGCVDLLVCDEGHRLKAAAGSKTISALLALRCPRRILVTGTPLQNNLDEFFGEAPSLHGSYMFSEDRCASFAAPILSGSSDLISISHTEISHEAWPKQCTIQYDFVRHPAAEFLGNDRTKLSSSDMSQL